MKNITFSAKDLNLQEIDLSFVRGGKEIDEVISSGRGLDGRTGKMTTEYLICYEDGSFDHAYTAD